MNRCVAKALVAVLGVGFFCCSAQADLSPIGDPFPTGSWSQAWKYDGGVGDEIDMFAVRVLSGSALASPALLGFSDPSWSVFLTIPGVQAFAQGTPTSMLGLFTHFEGLATDGVQIEFAVWRENENDSFAQQVASYDGGWSVGEGDWDITRDDINASMPAPASALLAMLGMPVVGWWKRRFRNG